MAFASLMYHSLSDGSCPDRLYPKYTTTRARFSAQLRELLDAGFVLESCAGLLARLCATGPFPERYAVLTFDDGHKSALDLAELMSAVKVTGTFFVTESYCRERPDFLDADGIRSLAAAGFDFGTHGVSHRALAQMPAVEMEAELSGSKRWLEEVLGRDVDSMSLPAGQGNDAVHAAAARLGYRLVGNSQERLNEPGALPFALNRFVILAHHNPRQVRKIATGSRAYIWRRRVRGALLHWPKRLLRTYDATRA